MASKKNPRNAAAASARAEAAKKPRGKKPAPDAASMGTVAAKAAPAGELPVVAVEDLPAVEGKPAKTVRRGRPPRSGEDAKKARANDTATQAAAAPQNAPAQKSRRPGVPDIGGAPRMQSGVSPRPMLAGNPYLPRLATVIEAIEETPTIRTLRVVLDDEKAMSSFSFEPGQVGQLSIFGAGEATFVINSPPSQKNYLQFSVMATGEVTDAIHRVGAGQKIGLRAPLGNFFPYETWKGRNVFFIGGGIGMAPIRTIMLHLLERKKDYGRISLLYGARSPADMAYSYELDDWSHSPDLDCHLCIDNPADDWAHRVGLIPNVLLELAPKPDNTVAVLCGPPIMIKFTVQALEKLGFAPENIITTLERRMKCGIGICGRCNIGDRYVCMDGPVFSWQELRALPQEA